MKKDAIVLARKPRQNRTGSASIIWCKFGFSSEPEVNERTKTTCVEGTEAEDESKDADDERDDVLPLVVFGEVDFVLHLEAELREGEEREEGRHEHGDVEMRVVGEVERREVKGKEALDEEPRQVDALDAEEATRQHDDEESEEHRRDTP